MTARDLLTLLLLPVLAAAFPGSTTTVGGNITNPNSTSYIPTCTDGGKLHCCEATFTGDNDIIEAAADLVCYNLTPAVVNCILTDDTITPDYSCVGEWACCQVNDLTPVIGLFCSKPPGDCQGPEGGQPPYCLDVIDGRFGNCTDDEVNKARSDFGLGPLVDTLGETVGTTLGDVLG